MAVCQPTGWPISMLNALKRRLGLSPRQSVTQAVAPAPAAQCVVDEAVACYSRGDYDRAERLAREAIEAQHDHCGAHLLLGQLCHRRGAYDDAADSYVLAACFAPELAESHLQLGLLQLDCGKPGEAYESLCRAVELAPADARVRNAAGAALVGLEQLDEARAHFEQALALDPDLADAHTNLGYLLYRDFEELEAGRRHIERALELAPDHLVAMVNKTMVTLRGNPAQTIELCDRLLARDPTLDPVRLNRGLAQLALGDFIHGWESYEARKSVRCNYVARAMPWPEWTGDPLAGRGLYIHTEQGLGDEIMFASCLPDAIAAAGPCIVECSPKLEALFARSFSARVVVKPSNDHVLQAGDFPGIAAHIAIGSLPRYLRRRADDFPRHSGYLRADPDRVSHWRSRLAALPAGLKVGIAWRGGVRSTQQSLRSTALSDWLPLLATAGVQFIDMQHVDCSDEREAVQRNHGVLVHRWTEAHSTYDETAAVVSALDLVVSVQTALVHLAGALGKETWGLIAAHPEWRYLAAGEHMPWYPAVRLFRQSALHEWRAPIEHMAARLRERAHG